MGRDAFVGRNKKPNIKLHLIIFITIVGVSVFLSTQVEKSKDNTRVAALKIPVPIDSVFVEADSIMADTKVSAPVVNVSEKEYRFDSGPNLAAIGKLLDEHDEIADSDIANNSIESKKSESHTSLPEKEKDIAIMVTDDDEAIEPSKITVAKTSIPNNIDNDDDKVAPVKKGNKKIGKMDTVYELQQDRFLETLAKTANVEAKESLEIKRMKEAMRADRPLSIKSTIKSKTKVDDKSDSQLVKVAATGTAGMLEKDNQSNGNATNTAKRTVVAKQSTSTEKNKQNNLANKSTNEILLTKSELNNVLTLFMRSYNKGDIQRLMALFDENASTNDQRNKQGIKAEYAELFKTTSDRNIKFNNVQWELGKEKAKGDAKFIVTVKPVGGNQTAQITGELKILAVKESRGVFIKSLLHEIALQ